MGLTVLFPVCRVPHLCSLRSETVRFTGVFVDTAEALLPLPPPSAEEKQAWFELAARDALGVGLVGIHDAFTDASDVDFYRTYACSWYHCRR